MVHDYLTNDSRGMNNSRTLMSDNEKMLIVYGLAGLGTEHALRREKFVQHQVFSIQHARFVAKLLPILADVFVL